MEKRIDFESNPLGTRPVPKLLFSLAVPSVIANVVNALYNIVDQIFIGHKIGFLGNAATNVCFPLTTICLAIGLMSGLGAASGFNLELGRKNPEKARKFAGTAFSALPICGILLCIVVRLFLQKILAAFGATENILSYATEYASITSLGIPFLLFAIGTNPLVRGDGNARHAMASLVTGTLLNVGLDALFMLYFDWGMAGAAIATVIGQAVSAVMLALYIPKFRSVRFKKEDFIPRPRYFLKICKLGFASFAFQSSTVLVQVTLNNLLKKYGAVSVYGSDVTIAAAGILQKINAIFISAVIGVVQGSQPICSFNYGAERYGRVRQAVKVLLTTTTVISTVIFVVFQVFTKPIIGLFGGGSELYFEFAVTYARTFTAVMFLNGIQISASTFFPSIGKAGKGAIISISKQLVFFIPLLFILSGAFGLRGLMAATPITDALAFILALSMLLFELKKMPKEDVRKE